MSDSAHNIYWKNKKINLIKPYTLSGYSRAAENTGFYCKELEMAFDAGVQMNELPAFICLTHLHNDHMCALNKMLIDNPKIPTIFIPNNDKFEHLLTSTLKYLYISSKFIHPNSEKAKDAKSTYPYKIVKLNVGESCLFKSTSSIDFYVEGLPSDHGVASISFGIYEVRKKCKKEFLNLSKDQYIELKKQGTEFTEPYKFPIMCYMSDTNIKPFESPSNDLLLQYSIIVVECTFLEPSDFGQAKKKNHLHWDQLKQVIMSNPKNKFILIILVKNIYGLKLNYSLIK